MKKKGAQLPKILESWYSDTQKIVSSMFLFTSVSEKERESITLHCITATLLES